MSEDKWLLLTGDPVDGIVAGCFPYEAMNSLLGGNVPEPDSLVLDLRGTRVHPCLLRSFGEYVSRGTQCPFDEHIRSILFRLELFIVGSELRSGSLVMPELIQGFSGSRIPVVGFYQNRDSDGLLTKTGSVPGLS